MILWYPPGAGGMWLNYFIWCGYTGKNIPGDHPHFELTYLKSIDKSYQAYTRFSRHTEDWRNANIVFGDDCFYVNFYLNLIFKKPRENWHYAAKTILSLRESSPVFNITWSTLFVNRSVFCQQISKLTNINIELNQATHTAIDQFIQNLNGKKPIDQSFLNSPAYYYWSCAVKDIMNLDQNKCLDFTETIYRPIENFLL